MRQRPARSRQPSTVPNRIHLETLQLCSHMNKMEANTISSSHIHSHLKCPIIWKCPTQPPLSLAEIPTILPVWPFLAGPARAVSAPAAETSRRAAAQRFPRRCQWWWGRSHRARRQGQPPTARGRRGDAGPSPSSPSHACLEKPSRHQRGIQGGLQLDQ